MSLISPGFAQTGAKIHEIDALIVKGAFTGLDPELMRHLLSLQEIEKARLNGQSTDINDILAWMAKCEKLQSRVEEPLEVRGNISVSVPPNTMGDEAYTTCYYAFSFNGLGFAGSRGDIVLMRQEKHPQLQRLGRPWNRDQILSTELFRLGYLKPDPIVRQYCDKDGSSLGNAVIEHRSNILIVTDTQKALDSLRAHIDSEVLEAMGMPASPEPGEEPRAPSLGAIASREAIGFYLMTFARWNRYPLTGAQEKGRVARFYPEAGLWTSEQGYRALAAEFQRIGQYVQLARETGGEGWVEPKPDRTLAPGDQKGLAIRFGLAGPAPERAATPKRKKTARKR